MRVIKFGEPETRSMALALGFFDSVHIGHQAVIGAAVDYAARHGCVSAVFTFRDSPYAALKNGRKLVLNFQERLEKFRRLGVETVVAAQFSAAFVALSREEFLRVLTGSYRLSAVFAGKDFTFGRNAEGAVSHLLEAFSDRTAVNVLDFLCEDGEKVSTSRIETLLKSGQIERANRLLDGAFCISGRVTAGHRVGRTLGFPTANLAYPEEKAELAPGVYFTDVYASGKSYPGITNVGARPTFSDASVGVESYLDGFSGDLYGKEITVRFLKYHRKTQKFESAEALASVLNADKNAMRKWRETR